MPAETSHRVVEVMNRPVLLDLTMSPNTQHRHVVFTDDVEKGKGDILLYLGPGFVNQRGCHEHREHHEVGLFTMS